MQTSNKITWEFKEIMERHDSNWGEWSVEGEDDYGNKYAGSCQADCSNPNDFHDDITDIELITPIPTPIPTSAPNLPEGKYYVEVDASVIKEAARHLYFIHNNAYPDPENYVQDRIYNGFVKDLTAVIPFILQKLTPVATPAPIREGQLVTLYKKYVQLLTDELNEVVGMAALHGWKSTRAERGQVLREEIEAASTQNNLREGVESASQFTASTGLQM